MIDDSSINNSSVNASASQSYKVLVMPTELEQRAF